MSDEFVPQKRPPRKLLRNVKIELSPEDYERYQTMAAEHGVSLKSFVKQAVEYAVARQGGPAGRLRIGGPSEH
jgi:hypothetical protein